MGYVVNIVMILFELVFVLGVIVLMLVLVWGGEKLI